MTPEPAEGLVAQPFVRVVRRAVPWLLLVVVGYVAIGYYGDYQDQAAKLATPPPVSAEAAAKAAMARRARARAASGTASATGTPAAAPSQVVAVTEVNFHTDPSAASDTIRTLRKDERLTLIAQEGGWYRVTDMTGQIGYLTTSATYTKLVPAGK
jgi:hypothetical protein